MVEPATAKKQITTELSSRQVTLSASQATAVFYATVYNDSDRFASFQVKLQAAGAVAESTQPWYRLTPSVSSKIPAGDCTRFQVEIFDLPPITQQFRGAIDLTLEVTSRELENQYDCQPLRLQTDGLQGQPPVILLTSSTLQGQPNQLVQLGAQLQNPTSAPLETTLRLQGLPDGWLIDGPEQALVLSIGSPQSVTFRCQIPAPVQAPSQIYPLQLIATGRFPSVTAIGQLHVLPAGTLLFACDPVERAIPEQLGRWQNPTQGTAEFSLKFHNQSNVRPGVQIAVKDLQPKRRWFWQKRAPVESAVDLLPPGVALGDLPASLSIGISTIPLYIQRRLPWFGWPRRQRYAVTAHLVDSPIPLQQDTQTVQVHLFPVIPLWQQGLGALLALGLGALTWALLSDPGHQGPVNSVQFNGQGTEVLSSSDDQTIRRWQVHNRGLSTQSRLSNLNKAVRVARYRPVNNDQVALGFENGEIQLANLLTGQRSRLTPDKDDRVFDLVFSRDARKLYSGHGSGLVLQWDIGRFSAEQTTPQRAYDTQFAIEAMALVGQEDGYLAVAGRFNRLRLLSVDKGEDSTQFLELTYPSGGSTDYITSLSASEQSSLLAIADTQGRISVWNSQDCLQNQGRCSPIDQPWLGHGGSAVRSVALSVDGCFLSSTGDDGQVKLWPLDDQGMRRSSALEGRTLSRSRKPLNAVDVLQTRSDVWVTSGGDDGRVRLYRLPLAKERRSSGRCPVLAGGQS